MAKPSTHINYSFEDIQRYLQGKMNAAEMHAMEKAALQDPFLADAIEGFNEIDFAIAQQHLTEINASLIGEKKESKIVAFNKKTQWLNIAALIIVLAGIGIVASYFFKSPDKTTQVAQVKNEAAKNEALQDSSKDNIASSSKKPDTTLLIAENKAVKKVEPLLRKKVIQKDAATNKSLEEDKAEVASVVAAPVQFNQNNISSAMDSVHDNLMTARTNKTDNINTTLQGKVSGLSVLPSTFSGKVVDENGDPVPFSTIRVNEKQSVVTDAMGYFNLINKDTALSVTTSAMGFTNNASIIKPIEQNVIMLNKNNLAMSDVVVTTSLGVSKKSKALANSAMPVGGWQNFNNYVLTQLNKDTTTNPVANNDDLVEMEFLIDNNGNPYNIKITKSLDNQRNEKAVQILKDGPKWINTSKKKKAKVSISF